MKILYLSKRLLSGDGSAIHGAAFIDSVRSLGHEIRPCPDPNEHATASPGAEQQQTLLKRVTSRLKSLNRWLRIVITAIEGRIEGRRTCRQILEIYRDFQPDVIVYRPIIFDYT
ncbi:MAG: hypothetical protein AAF420_00265, partial [Pseudomonadota bacterium]